MILAKGGSKLKGQNEQTSIQDNTKQQKKILHNYHKLPGKHLSKSGNFH